MTIGKIELKVAYFHMNERTDNGYWNFEPDIVKTKFSKNRTIATTKENLTLSYM